MKNILFIAFSSFIFLFVSCTSEQETETYIPIDEIIPLDIWGIERSGFFNGREKWAKGFENQRV